MGNFLKWAKQIFIPGRGGLRGPTFTERFVRFQKILELNNQILDAMAEMGDKLSGDYIFDAQYIRSSCEQISGLVYKLIYNFINMGPKKYRSLYEVFSLINSQIEEELAGRLVIPQADHVLPYDQVTRDFVDVVGSKNANIAEVLNFLGLPAPPGFAITTTAFQSFMSHNGLWEKLEAMINRWQEGELSLEKASAGIQSLIKGGAFPNRLKKEIHVALERLYQATGGVKPFLAIRSSAWGEDSEHSFAGQYLSLLNEPPENLLECYKAILASAYSATAMVYRRQIGFAEHEVAMAVACQAMIDAAASGVLYTVDPRSPERDVMVINAIWGLGALLVSGKVRADQFTLDRQTPHRITGLNVVRKAEGLSPKEGGGTALRPIPEDLQTKPCLTREQVSQLAEQALMIERYFKKPQDIEFSLDREGRLFILQTRPLNIKAQVARLVCDISSVTENYPVIFANRGVIVESGIGTGRVFLVQGEEGLDHFPPGSILVARYTSPRFARVIRQASGILTDLGSPTGHMATIAREFRVPTIVDTGVATRLLKSGQEITIDAEENVVYEGTVRELCYYEFAEEAFEETYEYRLLRRILRKISPLNLLNPGDKHFVPSACKTFHDITRFVHEKAVEQLIELKNYDSRGSRTIAKKLALPIPLDLVLIDIGNGLKAGEPSADIQLEQVASVPIRAFLEGLTGTGMWNTEPTSVDFRSFMSSLTRTFPSSLASPRFIGQNLAVVSREYANISLRLGYHFNMIDAYISQNPNDNYAYFRFLGGVTERSRRSRRAKFLAEVLAKNDFRVDIRGDLVVARIKKLPADAMESKMHLLGQLVAFTRQLDVRMISDQHISKFIRDFSQLTSVPGNMGGLGGEIHGQ